jgi:hypothetical protein
MTVLVRDGRIAAIMPSRQSGCMTGVRRIDGSHK